MEVVIVVVCGLIVLVGGLLYVLYYNTFAGLMVYGLCSCVHRDVVIKVC